MSVKSAGLTTIHSSLSSTGHIGGKSAGGECGGAAGVTIITGATAGVDTLTPSGLTTVGLSGGRRTKYPDCRADGKTKLGPETSANNPLVGTTGTTSVTSVPSGTGLTAEVSLKTSVVGANPTAAYDTSLSVLTPAELVKTSPSNNVTNYGTPLLSGT